MRSPFFKIIIETILFFISAVSALHAQDIERATRETDRLERQEERMLERQLWKIPEKPPKPKPEEVPLKEEKKFFVKKINLVGCVSFSPQEFASIVEKYENKEVSLNDLGILADEIKREYLRRGIIAGVFLPPQEIRDQTVILEVVEARMGELQIEESKYFKKKRLLYYWKLREGEIFRYDKLSKSIQLMNKNPDRQVKAALHAGKKPDTTDVILAPQTNFPLHFTASFDNEGVVSTGKHTQGYGIRHNNFLGFDDILLAGYKFGRDFNGRYIYHNIPISSYGTYLLYGYSRSVSYPTKEYTVYGLESKAKAATISLHQDLFKKDDYLGEVFLTFDAKDKTTWIAGTGVYNRDRLRIFRLGSIFLKRGFNNTTMVFPEFSQGVDAFGASPKGNPFASRHAKSVFSKFNLKIQHRRMLPLSLQLDFKFDSQFSSARLFPQEQFGLGGIDSVRGYPADDYMADNAILNSMELLIPVFFIPSKLHLPYDKNSLKEETTALVFLDYGWGMRRGALAAVDKHTKNLLSAGAGFRFNLYHKALLRLEWGFPLADNRPITEAGRSRFHFFVDFKY